MKLFLQKNTKFSSAGGSGGGGLFPQTPIGLWRLDAPPPPNTTPQLRISGYAPAQYSSAVSHKQCVDLIEHQVKCLLERSFITLLVTVC